MLHSQGRPQLVQRLALALLLLTPMAVQVQLRRLQQRLRDQTLPLTPVALRRKHCSCWSV